MFTRINTSFLSFFLCQDSCYNALNGVTQLDHAAEQSSAQKSEWKFLGLSVVICAAFLGALFLLLSDETVKRSLWGNPDISSLSPTFDSSLDPKLGTQIGLPKQDLRGDTLSIPSGSGKVLVVCCGQCSECSIASLKTKKIDPSAYDAVVLIYSGDEGELRLAAKKLPADFRVLHDSDSKLHNLFNATSIPRLALLDNDMKLIELQEKPNEDPGFLRLKL